MRAAFRFDRFQIREGLAGEAAGFLDEQRVIGCEFAAALAQYFQDSLPALPSRQSRINRGFHALAAGFVEMSKLIGA